MDRIEEINLKHGLLLDLIEQRGGNALWLRRSHNVSWITAGADASIDLTSEYGAYSAFITLKDERRWIVTDNIERPRLRAEERFGDLGFDYVESPWYSPASVLHTTPGVLTDDGEVEDAIRQIRCVLLESEQERLRALGRDAADALQEVARRIRPGDTERQISLRLDTACHERGGLAIVNMVGVDERISRFRHPLSTDKAMRKYAMLVVCMRRGGLVAAATRFVHVGRLPDDLDERLLKIAYIDAVAIARSQPGRTLGDVFADLQRAYAKHSEGDQWTKHHQGGLIGYRARERIATPGDTTVLQVGYALAWNPSVVGCKSEDTILLHGEGFEIVTAAPGWPVVNVEVDKHLVQRPGILEV